MTTEYSSKSSGTKSVSRKRKYTIVGVALAAVAVPTAAWAAITLFGFGDFTSDAATPTALIVENTKTTKSLVPGGKTGTTGLVRNNNDFPIKISHVIVKNSSVAGTGTGCDQSKLQLLGTPTQYPNEDGGGAGTRQAVAEQVVIAPNAVATVVVPESVEQDASASALCGLKGRYAVVATNASGS